jgi:glycosyltransferase involved in cell wall biosynthesis
MKISVFINTLNEEKRLAACLESVAWADEIVIVDMQSDDKTLEIARKYTDKIFSFKRLGYCEPARKFAAEQTTGDWILNLDADELVTAALKKELLRLASNNVCDAAFVPRKNYFWGEEIKYSGCGIFQDRPLRFYKRNAVIFNDVIHAGIQLAPQSRAHKIDNSDAVLLHFSFNSPEQYWRKMERYTVIEAKAFFDSGKEYTLTKALKEAWDAFYKRYIKKSQGHKDGEWGFIYCLWTAVYKINTYAQYKLMRMYKTSDYLPKIESKYEAIIAQTLNELKN